MKLGQLLHEALCEKYLGQTIESDFGDCFVVEKIVIEHGAFGDPPLEISFQSREYLDASEQYGKWQCENNPKGGVPTPIEIDEPFREACRNGLCCLSNLDDDLPEL